MQTTNNFIASNNATTETSSKRKQDNVTLVVKYIYRNVQQTCGKWGELDAMFLRKPGDISVFQSSNRNGELH